MFALERVKAVYQAIGEVQPKVKDRLFLVQSTLMDREQSRKKRQKLEVSLELRCWMPLVLLSPARADIRVIRHSR